MSRSIHSLGRPATASVVALMTMAALGASARGATAVTPGSSTLLSIGPGGEQFTGGYGGYLEDISADGTVALLNGQTSSGAYATYNALFLREGSTTTEVPQATAPAQGAGMSDSSRYVVYTSLVRDGLFRYDRDTAFFSAIVPSAPGANCGRMDVSDDGNTVAFSTTAALDPADANDACDTYVWRQASGVSWLRGATSAPTTGDSHLNALTPDGRYVLFSSTDHTLVADDTTTGAFTGLFLHDLTTGTTTLESRDNSGVAMARGVGTHADLTNDASTIVFDSDSDPTGEYPYYTRVYVRARATGQLHAIVSSINNGPVLTNSPTIDGAGHFVALNVDWGLVQARPQSNYSQVGVVNLTDGSIQLASHSTSDPLSDGNNQSTYPQISADGSTIGFDSYATDLVDPPLTGNRPRAFSYGVLGGALADRDGDGIPDVIDADHGAGTSPSGAFSNAYVSGQVLSVANGMTLTITQMPDPADGVRIQVAGPAGTRASIQFCGSYVASLRAGTDSYFSCGSVISHVTSGEVTVALPGGVSSVTVPAGAAAEVGTAADGTFLVKVLSAATSPVTLTVDGTTTALGAGTTTFTAWHFVGFSAPVDNGAVINKVNGGRAVPLKWRLTDATGKPVTSLASASVRFVPGACTAGSAPVDAVEQTATGASGLQNLGNGYYQYNWKTPTARTACGQLRLDVHDGVQHTARFQIT